MQQTTWYMQKIARPNSGRMFSEVAPPAHTSLSFQDIDRRILFAMVVNAGLAEVSTEICLDRNMPATVRRQYPALLQWGASSAI
jgi:hypothetical protein